MDYVKYSRPIIQRIADWERSRGTAACMVSDEEKIEFWEFIKSGFVEGSARAAMQELGDKF